MYNLSKGLMVPINLFFFSYKKIMNVREPIDALIEALSESSQECSISQDENGSLNNETPDIMSPPSSTVSPASFRRKIRIAKTLSSSDLKKKIIKRVNCKFCSRFQYTRAQVEKHLNESPLCQALYYRHLKVNTMEGILIKLFRCIACSSVGTFQLKRHLGKTF